MSRSDTVPYRHQLKAVRTLKRWGYRGLLSFDTGLGKSFTSILAAIRLPEARPVVVVCRSPLKYQWENEIKSHFGHRSVILNGLRPSGQLAAIKPQFVIVNYDILHKWVPVLRTLKPKFVVVDESQALINLESIRTQATIELCRDVPHVLCLSATPFTNRLSELYPTLHLIDPERFADFGPYAWRYCKPKRNARGRWDFKGADNVEELHDILVTRYMIRVRKQDVLPDLPPKIRTVVPVDLVNRKEYDHAVKDFLGWLADRHPTKLRGAMKAQQIVQIGQLVRLAAELKMANVESWLDDFLATDAGKILVFGVHRKLVEHLHQRAGRLSVLVNGSVTGTKRQAAIDRFQHDSTCRQLVGNLAAAGVGLTLTAAETVAFFQFGWTPGGITQAEDRCWGRLNDLHGANVFFLVARGTIEEKLLQITQGKQETTTRVLDGEAGGEKLDVYDQLTLALLAERKGGRRDR